MNEHEQGDGVVLFMLLAIIIIFFGYYLSWVPVHQTVAERLAQEKKDHDAEMIQEQKNQIANDKNKTEALQFCGKDNVEMWYDGQYHCKDYSKVK